MDHSSILSPVLIAGTPAGPTLLGVDVIMVATVMVAIATMAAMTAIYAAVTVRDPMAKRIKALNARRDELKAGIVKEHGRKRKSLVRRTEKTDRVKDALNNFNVLQPSQLAVVQQKLAHAGIRNKELAIVIIGLRAVLPILLGGFAFVMLLISWMQTRYSGVNLRSNDEFISASRSLKKGIVASGIVSAWTWAATLLQSSTVATTYGISGPFWYAAGATVQVLLFAMLAAKIKINAPFANTYLQVIKTRWGTAAHLSFLCFAIATSALVSAQLLLGGSECTL